MVNNHDQTGSGSPLAMAMDLGRRQWRLAFTTGLGQRPRCRSLPATQWHRLGEEIMRAKARFGLGDETRVVSCYEAGPDGFWIHRYLGSIGVDNLVVDPSSIEVNRRGRQAKTDRLDVERLLTLLLRYVANEHTALRVVRVPSEDDEQRRHLHRELISTTHERVRVLNRIDGLLATQGVHMPTPSNFLSRLPHLRQWNGALLGRPLQGRLEREWAKVELLNLHLQRLRAERREALEHGTDRVATLARQLATLRGIGEHSAWVFAAEYFAWRQLRNRRQVGALAGVVPLPHQSGSLAFDRPISKAGNRFVRSVAVQVAWGWIRYQPNSALTHWYGQRFSHGGPRARKIGIVAVARRLLIDLWRYVESGTIPEGAIVVSWPEVSRQRRQHVRVA
jgi:transposase